MKRLAILLAVILGLAACATSAPVVAPAVVQAKSNAQRALQLDTAYVSTLKDALALIRTPGTDPRVIQGVQNAVADCSRVFDQLEKATAAALSAHPENGAVLAGNLDDWIASADRSLKNLRAMMKEKPR